jgi:hypothetical protein
MASRTILVSYLGLVPVLFALSRSYQTSDSVVTWEIVVREKCARFHLAYEESLLVEEFNNRVKAGAPIDPDRRRHLGVVCMNPSLSVAGKIRGV